MNEDTGALLRRVEKLERQNKWMKWSGLVVLLSIASVLFYGATASNKIIEANEFRLVDENGKIRAALAFGELSTGLYLYDTKELCASLSVSEVDGAQLNLFATDGKARAEVSVIPKSSMLELYDTKSKEFLGMHGSGGNSQSYLILYDENGKKLFSAP